MKQPHYPGLEIDSDLRQQKREWMVQRIAWTILYALLASIAFGLIGMGPFSKSAAQSSDGGLRIEYERFVRHRSPDTLHVTLKADSGTAVLKLDNDYLQHAGIEKVTPQPERVVADGESVIFHFNTRPGTRMQATIEYTPERTGVLRGWLSLGNGPRARFTQFVYP